MKVFKKSFQEQKSRKTGAGGRSLFRFFYLYDYTISNDYKADFPALSGKIRFA